MKCDGSGRIQEKVERYATYPMIRTIECPGCSDCRCEDCFKGYGHYCNGREDRWVKYPYLICSMCTVGKTVACPYCHGTGRRADNEVIRLKADRIKRQANADKWDMMNADGVTLDRYKAALEEIASGSAEDPYKSGRDIDIATEALKEADNE